MKKRNKYLLIALGHFVMFALIGVLILKYSEEITELKVKLYQMRVRDTVAINVDFSAYEDFTHTGDEWYADCPLIYHAAGGIDGLDYTNSKEALENTLQRGGRVVEMDFAYTSDQKLVCMHEWFDQWDGFPDFETFYSGRIFGKYTPLSAEDFIAYMKQYEDLYLVIDTKEDDQIRVVQELIDLAEADPDVVSRFIVQLYDAGVKEKIQSIYPFEDQNYLFTVYKIGYDQPRSVLKICCEENISVVTFPYGEWDDETVNLFLDKNAVLFEHTINRPDWARKEIARGVRGVYTDFLAPDEELR